MSLLNVDYSSSSSSSSSVVTCESIGSAASAANSYTLTLSSDDIGFQYVALLQTAALRSALMHQLLVNCSSFVTNSTTNITTLSKPTLTTITVNASVDTVIDAADAGDHALDAVMTTAYPVNGSAFTQVVITDIMLSDLDDPDHPISLSEDMRVVYIYAFEPFILVSCSRISSTQSASTTSTTNPTTLAPTSSNPVPFDAEVAAIASSLDLSSVSGLLAACGLRRSNGSPLLRFGGDDTATQVLASALLQQLRKMAPYVNNPAACDLTYIIIPFGDGENEAELLPALRAEIRLYNLTHVITTFADLITSDAPGVFVASQFPLLQVFSVPTAAELGLPLVVGDLIGAVVPKDTPDSVVARLSAAFDSANRQVDVMADMLTQDLVPVFVPYNDVSDYIALQRATALADLDLTLPAVLVADLSPSVLAAMLVLCAVEAMVWLTVVMCTFWLRHERAVLSSSPFMVAVVCTGSAAVLASAVLMSFSPTPLSCSLQLWLAHIGGATVLAIVLLKLFRLYRIYHNKLLSVLSGLQNRHVMLRFAVLQSVVVALLVAWQILVPAAVNEHNECVAATGTSITTATANTVFSVVFVLLHAAQLASIIMMKKRLDQHAVASVFVFEHRLVTPFAISMLVGGGIWTVIVFAGEAELTPYARRTLTLVCILGFNAAALIMLHAHILVMALRRAVRRHVRGRRSCTQRWYCWCCCACARFMLRSHQRHHPHRTNATELSSVNYTSSVGKGGGGVADATAPPKSSVSGSHFTTDSDNSFESLVQRHADLFAIIPDKITQPGQVPPTFAPVGPSVPASSASPILSPTTMGSQQQQLQPQTDARLPMKLDEDQRQHGRVLQSLVLTSAHAEASTTQNSQKGDVDISRMMVALKTRMVADVSGSPTTRTSSLMHITSGTQENTAVIATTDSTTTTTPSSPPAAASSDMNVNHHVSAPGATAAATAVTRSKSPTSSFRSVGATGTGTPANLIAASLPAFSTDHGTRLHQLAAGYVRARRRLGALMARERSVLNQLREKQAEQQMYVEVMASVEVEFEHVVLKHARSSLKSGVDAGTLFRALLLDAEDKLSARNNTNLGVSAAVAGAGGGTVDGGVVAVEVTADSASGGSGGIVLASRSSTAMMPLRPSLLQQSKSNASMVQLAPTTRLPLHSAHTPEILIATPAATASVAAGGASGSTAATTDSVSAAESNCSTPSPGVTVMMTPEPNTCSLETIAPLATLAGAVTASTSTTAPPLLLP